MRIKEEFKRSGEFWLPSTPDKKVLGALSILDGGRVELEVTGLLEDSTKSLNLRRIVGQVQKERSVPLIPVTLDDCHYRTIPTPYGIPKSLIRVNRAFIGIQYDEGEVPDFNTLTFSVEGIEEWVGISGIRIKTISENDIPTMSYERLANFPVELENDMELLVTWVPSWGYSRNGEARISEKVYFRLVSRNVRKLDEFISVARKILTFFCFAVNQIVSLDSVVATSQYLQEDIGNGKKMPVSINIYQPSWPYSKGSQSINWYDMLFEFKHIQKDAQMIINKWMQGYEQSAPAFHLYFLARMRTQTYLEERFLTLAQGLEAYHRSISDETQMEAVEFEELVKNIINRCPEENRDWLEQRLMHTNDLSLRNRIKKMIEPFNSIFGNKGKRNALVNEIVETRNRLTHFGLSLEPSAATVQSLEYLCLKMELLFELHFLLLLGFSKEEVDSIIADCSKLRRKRDL